jgi:hypothetical protein
VPSWIVRAAEPRDHEQIVAINVEILRETEGQKMAGFGRALWEWQYLHPELPSLIGVADDHGTIAGYMHGLRFRYRFRGGTVIGSMTQDTATLPAYRRQGMMRATHAFVREGFVAEGLPFSVGFPNFRSYPDYERTNYTVVAEVPVYVRPLAIGTLLAERLRMGTLGRVLGRLADPVYRGLFVRCMRLRAGETVGRIERFDDSVLPVARAFADRVVAAIDRTPRFLNWRYVEKPTGDYECTGLWRGGTLRAFLVTRRLPLYGAPAVILMDLGCADGEDDALLRLIADRIEAARADGAAAAVLMGLHPFFAQLRRLGFVRVPERLNPRTFKFVVKCLQADSDPVVLQRDAWFVTLGDWDVL